MKWSHKLAVPLAILSVFSLGGVATLANFTSEGTSTMTATAGKIELGLNSNSNKSINIALGNAVFPGGAIPSQGISVRNSGTIPMKYTVAPTGTPGPLAAHIDVVAKVGTTQVYSGKLNAFKISSRTIAANNNESMTLDFAWPDQAGRYDTDLMGASGNTTLTFTATS